MEIEVIAIPLGTPATVNSWLLRGSPLTLVDTGPGSEQGLAALGVGLAAHGVALADLELILVTHHHLDHVGLAAELRRQSGARVAALARLSAYTRHYHERTHADRAFSRRVMSAHGVPAEVIDGDEGFWQKIIANTEDFVADQLLHDQDEIRAGGRSLRVIDRPGHSTTDTLFVDDSARLAFVGDHLLADTQSNTEMYPPDAVGGERPRSRLQYLDNLRLTAAMDLVRVLPGHGPQIAAPRALVAERLRDHRARSGRVSLQLGPTARTAFDLAVELWGDTTVRREPLLVTWEMLGHLDVLVEAGTAREDIDDNGLHRFAAGRPTRPRAGAPTGADRIART